jgi:hypothetical protein
LDSVFVRFDDLVKDGAISAVTRVFDALWRRRLRRSLILDKIIKANRGSSKRSRPLSRRAVRCFAWRQAGHRGAALPYQRPPRIFAGIKLRRRVMPNDRDYDDLPCFRGHA